MVGVGARAGSKGALFLAGQVSPHHRCLEERARALFLSCSSLFDSNNLSRVVTLDKDEDGAGTLFCP